MLAGRFCVSQTDAKGVTRALRKGPEQTLVCDELKCVVIKQNMTSLDDKY